LNSALDNDKRKVQDNQWRLKWNGIFQLPLNAGNVNVLRDNKEAIKKTET
jgi:hypothetical protein